ncbi:hypothetical protein B0T22DRAFT_36029 [Podospora appendiculata]|uniref:Rhodopsin domain-containing protein n=1 Tax=Podospora appendiculata TaxID=314037 RepID=A0AAE0XHC5_9PEZI|nr:hypothetical protein B0T22DRAFT_36029 [Podospora appendiculata]
MSPLPPPPIPPKMPADLTLVSHQGAGPQVNAIVWTLFMFCTLFLALRLYAKKIERRGLWWDDYILCVAWVVHLVACTLLGVMVSRGYGNHPWDKIWGTPEEILYMWVRNTLAMTAAAWSKTAFAVTLLRFSEGWMKWVVWFILISMNAIIALNATMNWVGCTPIEKSWIPSLPGECADILSYIITIGNLGGGYSAACDFVLAFLPWVIIWNLQMRLQEKIGVGVAMSMGIAAGIMAAIKTAHLTNLATGDSYDAAMLNIWDSAEVSVTIMAASIPTLRVFFRDIAISSSGRRKYYPQNDQKDGSGNQNSKGKSQNHSVVIKSRNPLQNLEVGSDDSILSSQNKIYRTDEVEVKHMHGDVTDTEDGGNAFEMQRVK